MADWPTIPAGAGYPLVDASTGEFLSTAVNGALSVTIDAAVGTTTVAISSQMVAPGLYAVNPWGLRRWYAALADARDTPARVVCIGDSLTKGVGADGLKPDVNAYDDIYRQFGWVGQLRRLFAEEFGDAGEGWIGYTDTGGRVALGPGATAFVSGTFEQGLQSGAGTAQWTVTPDEAFTELESIIWDGGSGTYSITVDGGTPVPFSAGGGDTNVRTWTAHEVDGLADSTHTVVFDKAGAGNTYWVGMGVWKQPNGVRVYRMGKGGNTTHNVLGQDSANHSNVGRKERSLMGIGNAPPADLVIVSFLANDFAKQNATDITANAMPGCTPAVFEANLRTIAAQAVSTGAAVLILGQPFGNPANYPSPMTHTQQAYIDKMKLVASDTDHVCYLGISDEWGTHAQGDDLSYYTAESVHPTRRGHASMARVVHRLLTAGAGVQSSVV